MAGASTRHGDNVVARTDLGRDQRLLLVGHLDTVPANGNDVARIDGDTLWGLGSADMKSGLAVFLELARTVREPVCRPDLRRSTPPRRSPPSTTACASCSPSAPIWSPATPPSWASPPTAGSRPAARARARVRITLRGARAHTARPWKGRNAIHRLGPVARRDRCLRDPRTDHRWVHLPRGACRPCSSTGAWPATSSPTRRPSPSTCASRPTARSTRRSTTCAVAWRRTWRTATAGRSSTGRHRRRRR